VLELSRLNEVEGLRARSKLLPRGVEIPCDALLDGCCRTIRLGPWLLDESFSFQIPSQFGENGRPDLESKERTE
jgi:hypothetical protein